MWGEEAAPIRATPTILLGFPKVAQEISTEKDSSEEETSVEEETPAVEEEIPAVEEETPAGVGEWTSRRDPSLFTGVRGRGILRSSLAGSCIELSPRAARMASEA